MNPETVQYLDEYRFHPL